MSLARLMPDLLQVVRRTQVEDDYGSRDTWADVGSAIPAKVHLDQSSETLGNRDTTVTLRNSVLLGWPDVTAADRVRDQHGRTFEVDGEPQLEQTPHGRMKHTVIRLRSAADI
jgi:head-tail adaptor